MLPDGVTPDLGISRKRFLSFLGASAAGVSFGSCARDGDGRTSGRNFGSTSGSTADTPGDEAKLVEDRVSGIIAAYDSQGIHRTGTGGDQACARWLAEEVDRLGVESSLEGLPFRRIDVVECSLEIAGRRIDGVPLFNAPPTPQDGIAGRLSSSPDGASELGFMPVSPRGGTALGRYRSSTSQAGVIAVTGGSQFGLPPGLALINAEGYATPSGPSTIHVGSESLPVLQEAAASGTEVRFINHFVKRETEVYNTTATVHGSDPSLPPLIVMTPRSGWWNCASERGGGIAVWLEMMRGLKMAQPARSVYFVASTGHELGHYGLDAYLETRHELIQQAVAWIHLGANFGAAVGGAPRFQSSDEEYRQLGLTVMSRYGRQPARETVPGDRPAGEARNIFDGGGRYFSLLGGNGLFHHPDDRWPDAVDVGAVAAFARAFTDIAIELSTG